MADPGPYTTWGALLRDPRTTIAGIIASCAILSSLPLDRPVTWILALSAFLGGLLAADRKPPKEGTGNGT